MRALISTDIPNHRQRGSVGADLEPELPGNNSTASGYPACWHEAAFHSALADANLGVGCGAPFWKLRYQDMVGGFVLCPLERFVSAGIRTWSVIHESYHPIR